MDSETRAILHQLNNILNDNIDILIRKRNNAIPKDKYEYRYICRKLENAVGNINKAIDKFEANV